jgi:hypothetical protein
MKRLTLRRNCSDEAFNAGKEIEAMKHASSLHRFCSPALLKSTVGISLSLHIMVQ